ncbi:hypothetical protein CTI12_AA143510 [Artemisia annua]|uniref:Uncharacterized protein n=1 Tax=Artemisia annua TaxID=35608 RepID=A0A2U1PJM1_ARTAN|nr:hypothetical protein CTI12_AA143510 [Artemisia annua]
MDPDSPVLYYTPQTVIDLSAPTCATRSEANIYHGLANAPADVVFMILDPATGIADDEFKASIIKRYSDQVPQASFLKRHRESSETVVAERGSADGVLEASLLKRHCKEPGESSEIVVADLSSPTTGTADEVVGAYVPQPYYEDLVE